MTPQEFVEIELNRISAMFKIQKVIGTHVMLIKDERRFVYPIELGNHTQRDVVSQGIKDLVKRAEPDVVMYVAEAWMSKLPRDYDLRNFTRRTVPPSLDPLRVEIVIVQIEFKTGEKFTCQADIQRNGHQVHLGEFKAMTSDTTHGRFMDFYPQIQN